MKKNHKIILTIKLPYPIRESNTSVTEFSYKVDIFVFEVTY